ncbi:hypothetical protein GGS21DRAFT_543257 [Xylaria nigripes]|nr:hypothetical protein GGS21DRAFT_543257 [Xylaria nigripes]
MSVSPISPAEFAAWFNGVPECGASCLIDAIETQSNCSLTDKACSCASKAVQEVAGECIARSCTIPDALTTQNVTYSSCGVTPGDDVAFIPIIYTFVTISSILVALRFVARFTAHNPLWWDDYACLISGLVSVAFTVVCGLFRNLGAGLDLWAVPQENLSTIMILLWAALMCYLLSRFFIRLSISLFLLRIFRVSGARPIIISTLVLNGAITVVYYFCVIFQCTPISLFWTMWDGLHKGHCINVWAMFLSGGLVITSLDIVITVLPIYWVYQLQFSRSKKITTLAMFSLSVVVIATSIMRLISLHTFTHSPNFTHNLGRLAIWGGLELYVAIICACLPSLRPLVKLSISGFQTLKTRVSGSTPLSHSGYPIDGVARKKLPSEEGFGISQFEMRTVNGNDVARI